jgi:TRAP transporter TAXI family solute receptor
MKESIFKTGARKIYLLMLVFLLAIAVSGCGSSATPTDISVGTGSTGGVYQIIGTAIANIINEKLTNVRATAEPAPALTQTARFINTGEFTLGMLSSDVANFARQGTQTFAGEKLSKVRTLIAGHEVGIAYVVLDKSPIKSLADLKGRRIGAGSPAMSLPLLELAKLYGIKAEDVKFTYTGFTQQVEALQNGTIDMAILSAYPKASALMDLTESTKVRFISVDADKMAQFVQQNPYWKPREVPAKTYKWQDQKYAGAPGQYLLVGVNADADTDMVYNIVKAVLENNEYLAKAHPAGKEYTLEQIQRFINMDQITAPFHPGVAKYLQEKGIKVDSALVQ